MPGGQVSVPDDSALFQSQQPAVILEETLGRQALLHILRIMLLVHQRSSSSLPSQTLLQEQVSLASEKMKVI